MISESVVVEDIEWDVSSDDAADTIWDMDGDEQSRILGIPLDALEEMDKYAFTDAIYDTIYADPDIIYEIFDLPLEEEIPFSMLDFTDDESLKESAIEYLEEKYGFLINKLTILWHKPV